MIALAQSLPEHFAAALRPVPLSLSPCSQDSSCNQAAKIWEWKRFKRGSLTHLARRRFSSSPIDGGQTKMNIASRELAFTDLAPWTSMSRMHLYIETKQKHFKFAERNSF